MYKLTALLLVTCVSLALFAQQEHDQFEKFMQYQEDPTIENFVQAIEYYNSEENNAEDHMNYILLANLYLAELEKNLEFLKTNIDSLSMRDKFQFANVLLEAGKFDECIEIYNGLNVEAPNWSCPWRHKGEALLKSDNFAEAEIATLKAIETREEHFDAYLQLAEIQKELGKYEAALQTLETGLKYSGQDYEEEVTDDQFHELKQEIIDLMNK
jgi:tetratricopeptide (TPR) repeat protein